MNNDFKEIKMEKRKRTLSKDVSLLKNVT
jgi:hypothetical protein